ncbi:MULTISPECIES: 5-(carboxyamino)imidazole ribonucleotide mutase [Peptoniphilus]|uniref:N5-carboxyaminoimidazole ribonucleotide mutase n=1 Tax=Peptoniphilus lacrimalis TaxID=33031 RepID=A0A379C2W0_9FIRM|nr:MULTISPECIES: 5-(carboxyamino)imidazole ribonucleotide mutase [Peptoniphilus]EFK39453.1 phosphoribosylaminoimidazole carboxylase, catalytic subunit [Peptoniphilus sp. oral taxon 836 str. F0141]MDK7722248.1 5-(carboxyamino)imidazole ribonucleotide mutase [Peptoniphilus lacrimalis]MDK7731850.1 5-(carboxyamino)imidazole ribonucleotide mutase [Peptoniphilus lacrimalis]MDK8281452.1 5-(carboxyamino)imidazole ribonucleotide mutase [Peptoniphilus lacrimalis]SUB56573.1 N5-carboxyaminoimidazole ribon
MRVSIIMGSISDREIADKVVKKLKEFDVHYEVKVISAHRALDLLKNYVENAQEESEVFIGIAGKAAHLAGVIAGITTRPVIGIPVKSSLMDGLDSLLSTVQMPSGVPVATVAVNGGENAAILAVQMLALKDQELQRKLDNFKKTMAEKIKNTEYRYEG